MRKIKILEDTPFNKKDDIIDVREFRSKYDYVCLKQVTDEDLLNYLIREHSQYVLHPYDSAIGRWFSTVAHTDQVFKIENLPLAFIHEDLYYTKEMDGMYHVWSNPSQKALRSHCIRIIGINKALDLLNSAKFKQEILYCTDYSNKKL